LEIGSDLIAVERAVSDLRRGYPVLIQRDQSVGMAVATELLKDSALKALAAAKSEPSILLTQERAATLKIRPYTEGVVAIPLPAAEIITTARSLSDPSGDLMNPMRGPFHARRETLPPTAYDAIALAKLAALLPSCAYAPLASDLKPQSVAGEHNLITVQGPDIQGYPEAAAQSLTQAASAKVPLEDAEHTQVIAFRPSDGGQEHLAIIVGDLDPSKPVLVRLHSECFTGDLLASLKCDCGDQLRGAIRQMGNEGSGVLLYLSQEGRGIGLLNKLRAYRLQDQGFDTIEANERLGFEADERLFSPATVILSRLGISKVRLLTNNPDKVTALQNNGVDVVERVAHAFPSNKHNERYLDVKKQKSGHLL